MLEIDLGELTERLRVVKDENHVAEKALQTAYENAEKQYTEALDSYDTEMREKNTERDNTRADMEDQEHQLQSVRTSWLER